MFFRLSFVTFIFAAVALGMPVKRDEVESDIQALEVRVQALDTSIQALPDSGGTLTQISTIQKNTANVETALKTAKNDATASAVFTEARADTIIGLLEKDLIPLIKKTLDDLVAKKTAISALNAATIVISDLKTLEKDTDAYGTAMVTKTPAGKQSSAQEQLSAIESAISSAIDAYSA